MAGSYVGRHRPEVQDQKPSGVRRPAPTARADEAAEHVAGALPAATASTAVAVSTVGHLAAQAWPPAGPATGPIHVPATDVMARPMAAEMADVMAGPMAGPVAAAPSPDAADELLDVPAPAPDVEPAAAEPVRAGRSRARRLGTVGAAGAAPEVSATPSTTAAGGGRDAAGGVPGQGPKRKAARKTPASTDTPTRPARV